MLETFAQIGVTISAAGVVLWYVRRQARAFNNRLNRMGRSDVNQGHIIASANAAALLAARFPNAYMPVSDFTMSPVNLQGLLAEVEAKRPSLIVEVGSGQSTLVLAAAARAWGGRIVSFDQSAAWLELCLRHLAAADLAGRVSLHLLTEADNAEVIAAGEHIDFLIVDGPFDPDRNGARQRQTMRFLARLASDAVIYLDDAARPLEQQLIDRLRAEFPEATIEERGSATGFAFVRLGAGASATVRPTGASRGAALV